ncbi:myotubularin-related protein 3 isoform X2 [Lucilia cuprina]|uniref:myotubularin-related protein 3 isoform X2 n=1 Tax=Lucilia cuprina TaxID=7375 RepID=UPI001F052009|nr:myotubularin-related protein 3 isoform X2 [Lucilia cuprina]
MEASDGSPPPSLCMIRAAELFPKPQMEKEDLQLKVPFQELAGESVKYLGRTDDGVLALSNYRIFLQKSSTNVETSIPLGLIESAQCRDLFHLIICCKDASTVKCSFETAEQCTEWQRRIQLSVGVPETLESIFAFPFCSWACDSLNNGQTGQAGQTNGVAATAENGQNPTSYSVTDYGERLQKMSSRYEDDFMREVERLGFDLNGSWRISQANEDFKLCPSYPPKLLVPCCISDETLQNVANFRGSRRLPAVVWRHRKSGAVIARCSQPEVGWLGWRNTKDEQLLKALADACAFDRGEQMRQLTNTSQSAQSVQMPSADSSPSSPDGSHEEVALDEVRKVLIVDARSYTSAVTNRARGGGCECIEYYPCAEIEFMNLGNIHVIRKSFHALRQLCASPPDVPNWLGLLEKTMWLQHLSGLLAASMTVCHAIEKKGRPVLVHCSDGWDRTPQIVATAQLCLDPYYRTVEGFRVLVEREWLSYGHKFADRCGHGPGSDELNERCPVFLQWLDLVHQIHKQFRCSFEFSMGYLIKLAQHSHSGLFGNFLCNTLKERLENSVFERTFSVWSFLSGPMYRNPLYKPNKDKVLWPAHNVRDLSLWTEVYLGSLGGNQQNCIDFPAYINESLMGSISSMSKTRSYGDLITAGFIQNSISRRSSDPNMTVDPNLTIGSNSENNSIADLQSDEREESPDLLANFIHDTTRKLENLTNELNNHDNDDFASIASKHIEINRKEPSVERETTDSSNATEELDTSNYRKELNGISNTSIVSETTDCAYATKLQRLTTPQPPAAPPTTLHIRQTTSTTSKNSKEEPHDFPKSLENGHNGIEHSSNGITIEKHSTLSLNLMQSVELEEPLSSNQVTSCNGGSTSTNGNTDATQSMWHGSVNTSTDTLVPLVETKSQNGSATITPLTANESISTDCTDAGECLQKHSDTTAASNSSLVNTQKHQTAEQFISDKCKIASVSTNYNILPKIHTTTPSSSNITTVKPNQLSTNGSSLSTAPSATSLTTTSTTAFAETSNNSIQNNLTNSNNDNKIASFLTLTSGSDDTVTTATNTTVGLEESILILPEHQKLEISFSGKCEMITANVTTSSGSNMTPNHSLYSTTTTASTAALDTPTTLNVSPFVSATTSTTTTTSSAAATTAMSSQRRRRTSSSNSKRDAFGATAKQINSSYLSRFSLPGGVRSLPMTPPGLTERPQVTISCPDGLAHALSEENIRLQQIVHEHKLREDVLLREIHDMRMALLKKICPNCNNANANATNDEQTNQHDYSTTCCHQHSRQRFHHHSNHMYRYCCQYHRKRRQRYCSQRSYDHVNDNDNDDDDLNNDGYDDYADSDDNSSVSACSALDNVENASICSWEAVEDRSTSGPSSCTTTSSSVQPNATSVLWVPDHAVSRCTSCQTEFWLGRRKHHCRSCGQIFCADCSEFWAPLPDIKLFSPARLCGPCYHSVTTRMQQVNNQLQNSTLMHLQQSATKPAATSKA